MRLVFDKGLLMVLGGPSSYHWVTFALAVISGVAACQVSKSSLYRIVYVRPGMVGNSITKRGEPEMRESMKERVMGTPAAAFVPVVAGRTALAMSELVKGWRSGT